VITGLSRCLKLAAAVAVLLAACASVCLAYDRQAALDYALDFWDKVCSDGYYFVESTAPTLLGDRQALPTEVEGFDCAHFVSCCIGSEPSRTAGGLILPSRTSAYGEPGAQRLTDWLLDQGATQAHDISNLVPGDIVAYDADHNGWIEHVALYMGNGLVTAHSLSRYSEWNPDPTSDFVFIHLPGAYHPPQAPATLGVLSWLLLVASVIRLAASVFFRLR
jgi:Putative amidase domain